jgi:hypothetical protein
VIEVGVAQRALDGMHSGDRAVVADLRGGGRLLAVIDGLGHGPAAAEAAERAAVLLQRDPDAPMEELFQRCHFGLMRTRGAVMTLVRIRVHGELEWAGVGNVEARLVRSAHAAAAGGALGGGESPVLFGGVLGLQVRTVRPSITSLGPGDLILMATDGVRGDFVTGLPIGGPAQALAERALQRSGRPHDDALVLVARWVGAPA